MIKLFTVLVFSGFCGVKFMFIDKISQNYTDIKILTQQAMGSRVLAAYCFGESCVCVCIYIYIY